MLNGKSALPAPVYKTGTPFAEKVSARHEAFARAVATGESHTAAYAKIYRVKARCAQIAGSRLACKPKVIERIRQLNAAAAERAEISIAARMAWLDSIVRANPAELTRVVACPCPACWDSKAIKRYPKQSTPDQSAPRSDCLRGPHHRIELVPTSELSGSARALYRGARQRSDGSIEVLLEDRQAASDQLNRMQSVYVSKSINLNVSVQPLRDLSADEAMALLESFSERR